ncbi:MAG: hydantoinase/oxoprolinase family protein [Thiotrichales bacterium]
MTVIGWDIGGAHLKAALIDDSDRRVRVVQRPCPLWQGLDTLRHALSGALAGCGPETTRHYVTMTGELADCFSDRREGVREIARVVAERLGAGSLAFYAGPNGFVAPAGVADNADWIASANWHASVAWSARQMDAGLFIDLGSTTADLVPFADGAVRARGYSDAARLRHGELVYTGVVRTPVMALARQLPLRGEWIGLMAEHFATIADVYRVLGELPAHADQHPSADGAEKSVAGSRRRLARMLGVDAEDMPAEVWHAVAGSVREAQVRLLHDACVRLFTREGVSAAAPLVGAGVGRFLIKALAVRLDRPYIDLLPLLPTWAAEAAFDPAECVPAVTVALLGREITNSV